MHLNLDLFAERKWGWVGVDLEVRASVLQGGVRVPL